MSEGMDIADDVKLCIKENFKRICFWVIDLIGHLRKLEFQALPYSFVMVGFIKLGIGFDKVEDSVHGLICHKSVFRKDVVGD